MTEPHQANTPWPRYSARLFPSSRFVPGRSLHPRHNSNNHCFGLEEPRLVLLPTDQWSQSDDYLYGIDLYNYDYWWECHEVFEGLWNIAGHSSEQGNFFQALIQLAAANLKLFMGSQQAARNLLQRGLVRLERVPESYMGVDVTGLINAVQQQTTGTTEKAPLIPLSLPSMKA